MKKCLVFLCVLLLALSLSACVDTNVILGAPKTYEIADAVHSLDIRISAADLVIGQGANFSVESNLKNLTVTVRNGVLTVADEPLQGVAYADAMLTLYVPEGTVFESASVVTGAAKLTVDTLSADSVTLKLGAGKAEFGCLNAQENADIEGGAGEIVIRSGTVKDLSLDLGVGKLDMTAALLGQSRLHFGVGESRLTLTGSKEDYAFEIKKGIGSITFDAQAVGDSFAFGNGSRHINVEGGVGTVEIIFEGK